MAYRIIPKKGELMKKVSLVLMLIIIVNMICSIAIASDVFPDLWIQQFDKKGEPLRVGNEPDGDLVFEEHWATRSISKSTKIGLIEGYHQEDGTYVFKPEQDITRAEFIKMAIILATNRTFDFNTVPTNLNHWAGKYVKVAEMQNVIPRGLYDDSNLDEAITRIEMICILSKIQINMKGIAQNTLGKLQYTDIADLTEDEKALLLHAAKYTLISDMLETTTFEPNKNLTRAEATVAIMKIY